MNGNRIIVHTLIKTDNKYLVIKRSETESVCPLYWDLPGGLVEYKELPRDAVIRETKEEIGLNITPTKVIHEDSNYDSQKDMVFIRLVYLGQLNDDIKNIKLQLEEHCDYKLINDLSELSGEKIVDYLVDILQEEKTSNK